ncbi:MAG: recombinase family protein [Oscillospiraceae bacterium]|nr:recombinase family protein [Oscillospiraceae bacterium]
MNIYGYIRVSDVSQNLDRQQIAMDELKIPKGNIFTDKQSGKNTARPGLQRLFSTVAHGDTVIVESVSRFARNTRDLLDLIDRLTRKGVEFVSLKERIDTTTPTGKFMLTVFGAVAELERGYILQRQAEGIAAAKRRGVHLGRPIKKPPENFGELVQAWENKQIPLSKVLEQCGGMCAATFYRRLSEYRSKRRRRR